jgi:predicted alpha-1,2-mannosidase
MIKRIILFTLILLPVASFAGGLSEEVNTMIGAGGAGLVAGNCFPGATMPHGMVQFTPSFFSRQVGFTVNQLMGAGCPHMGNFPTLAMKGEIANSPYDMVSSRIMISKDKGHAGYYEAEVQDDIHAELTATERTGMARYTFPTSTEKGTVIVGGGVSSTPVKNAAVVITSPHSIEGFSEGGNFCGFPTPYKIYFVAEFDSDASIFGTWKQDKLFLGADFSESELSGVFLTFNLNGRKKIGYKFAISYVSVENAKENLKAENPDWDFDAVKSNAEKAWDAALSKIEVRTDNKILKEQFYTHLYHALTVPTLCSDVNGEYMGADGYPHKSTSKQYSSFSNWDTYRTQIQLLSILEPEVASDIVVSHQDFAEQAGGSFPRWVLANVETGIMQGDPTPILISNAYAFGARNFDARRILKIMEKGATVPGAKCQTVETRPELKQYLEKGWCDASIQLEYVSSDFAIGRFAKYAADDEFASFRYFDQAKSWKNLFNPESGWLQSRNEDGSWKPLTDDFREATYKNYFWMVPFDFDGLFKLIGGAKVAEARLDEYFGRIDASYWDEWFACGNEPSFHDPWIYNWTGSPFKTQALVNRILKDAYKPTPDGLPGNDDLGTMGAWYVFACIGLYPVIPGVGGFSINTPIFDEITLHLNNGDLEIKGGSESDIYIKKMKVDGVDFDSTWISWERLQNGAKIECVTSARPSKTWGLGELPPSFD